MHYTYRTCPCGEIRGIGTEAYDLFKSVPYAKADRWESPVPVTHWEGTFDATMQGHACPQSTAYGLFVSNVSRFYRDETVEKQVVTYSEDCLSLNIWAPRDAKNAPVLVWIHGGSYETGNGSAPITTGAAFCREGIVQVNINYRLNAFASAYGDGHRGNYGLQDQICALEWVQRNIAAFGGDPEKVTVMGESAGAMSVQNLLFAPMTKGLFRGAIMLSGGGILPRAFRIKTPEDRQAHWDAIKEALGVATIEELKQVPAKELITVWKKTSIANPRFAFPATPVADGRFIPDTPLALAQAGNVTPVPTIISVLSEDMWPHTLYETAVEWAELMEAAGLPPVYGMYFDRQVPGSDHGAYHACDVKYVFNTLDTTWRPYTDTDRRISRDMIGYFAGFVKTGVPQAEGLPAWLPLSKADHRFMHFGDAPCSMEAVPADRLQATESKGKPFPGM